MDIARCVIELVLGQLDAVANGGPARGIGGIGGYVRIGTVAAAAGAWRQSFGNVHDRMRIVVVAVDADAVVVIEQIDEGGRGVAQHLFLAPAFVGKIEHAARLVENQLDRDVWTFDAIAGEVRHRTHRQCQGR